MAPNTPTNFENSKHRRIYQGARGGFFIRRAKKNGNGDVKVSNPVAKFRKVGANGAVSKLTKDNLTTVPTKIRGKRQGYINKTNESLGQSNSGRSVSQKLKARRNESQGERRQLGQRPFRSNKGKTHVWKRGAAGRLPGFSNLPIVLPANVMAPRRGRGRPKGRKNPNLGLSNLMRRMKANA